jgi:hypothetical protein
VAAFFNGNGLKERGVIGKPLLLLASPGVYPDTLHFRSALELAAGLQTAKAGLNAAWPGTRSSLSAGGPNVLECSLQEIVFL